MTLIWVIAHIGIVFSFQPLFFHSLSSLFPLGNNLKTFSALNLKYFRVWKKNNNFRNTTNELDKKKWMLLISVETKAMRFFCWNPWNQMEKPRIITQFASLKVILVCFVNLISVYLFPFRLWFTQLSVLHSVCVCVFVETDLFYFKTFAHFIRCSIYGLRLSHWLTGS